MAQFDYKTMPLLKKNAASITGPGLLYPGQSGTYTITNYDDFHTWAVSTDKGSVSRTGDQITLDIHAGEPTGTANITVDRNGIVDSVQITVAPNSVAKPTVLTPVDGAVDVVETPTITLSAFSTFPADFDTEQSVSVRILKPDNSVAWQLLDQPPGTDFTVPAGVLSPDTNYRPQGRYKGNVLGYGEWSDLYVSFTTAATFGPTAAGTMYEGWVVAGQIAGDWLLVATAVNRAARKWGLANIDTTIANLGVGTDTETETGTQKTNILVSQTYSTHVDNYSTTGCPAAEYARGLGGDLPMSEEVSFIYQNLALIDSTDDSGGGNTLAAIANGTAPSAGGDRHLWSSSERNMSEAWRIQLQTGAIDNVNKASTMMVIPVRRIPV